MTTDALIALVRQAFIDDGKTPYQWSDEVLISHANEAQRSACRRAGLLVDEVQASDADGKAICTLPIVAGTATYSISSKILRIIEDGTYLTSTGLDLVHTTKSWLNEFYPTWRAMTGTPVYFFYQDGRITLVPNPTASDTLNLNVVRLPLVDMILGGCELVGASDITFNATNKTITTVGGNFLTNGFLTYKTATITGTVSNNKTVTPTVITAKVMTVSESLVNESNVSAIIKADSYPEIAETYHYALVDGICDLAYRLQDSEAQDMGKVAYHGARFTAQFGREPSAMQEESRRRIPVNRQMRPKVFGG